MLEPAKYKVTFKLKIEEKKESRDIDAIVRAVFAGFSDDIVIDEIQKNVEVIDSMHEVSVLCRSLPASTKSSEDIAELMGKELSLKTSILTSVNIQMFPKVHGVFAIDKVTPEHEVLEFQVDLNFLRYVARDREYRQSLLNGRVVQIKLGYQEIPGVPGQLSYSGITETKAHKGEVIPPSKANPYNFVAMLLEENEPIRTACNKHNVTGMFLSRDKSGEFFPNFLFRDHRLLLSIKVNGPSDSKANAAIAESIKAEFASLNHAICVNNVEMVSESLDTYIRKFQVTYIIRPTFNEEVKLAKLIEDTLKPKGLLTLLGFETESKWMPAIRTPAGPVDLSITYDIDLNFIRLLVNNSEFCHKVASGNIIGVNLRYPVIHGYTAPWVYSADSVQLTSGKNPSYLANPYVAVAKRVMTETGLREACLEDRISHMTVKRNERGGVDIEVISNPKDKVQVKQLK